VEVLTVIPARAGSKGVKNKNLRPLGGIPLIAHAIRIAQGCGVPMRVVVSTDSEEIAEVARAEGAEVPFMRPPELAQDHVAIIPVIQHAMHWFDDQGWRADIVVSLQATAPFTPSSALERGIRRLMGDPGVDSAVAVTLIPSFHPFRAYSLHQDDVLAPLTEYTSEKYLQRQDRPPAYGFTGGFYIRKRKLLEVWDGKGFALGAKSVGEVVPEHAAVDINSPVDLLLAESILKHRDELEGRS